jgi:hypothetical protein
LKAVFDSGDCNDDNSYDTSVGIIDDDRDAAYEDTCCKNPYLLKRKFALDNVPSSSGATCSFNEEILKHYAAYHKADS